MFAELEKKIKKELIRINLGALILVLIFSVWLYFDFKGLSENRGEEIGKIVYKVKDVKRKYKDRIVWEGLEISTNIYNFDTIRTDDLSRAKVILKDKTEIEIEENSMVVFNLTKEKLDLNFMEGKILLNSLNTDRKAGIRSGNNTIDLDKSEIKIEKKSSENINIDVLQGKAEVRQNEKVIQVLEKNDELKIRGETIKKERKKLRLVSPVNSKYFLTEKSSEVVIFEWDGEGDNFKIQIFDELDSSAPPVKKDMKGNKYQISLKPSRYRWSVSISGEISKEEKFYVVDNNPVILHTPDEGKNFNYTVKSPQILISWSKNPFIYSYKLEISKDKEFVNLAHSITTENETYLIDTLEEGKYFYRVITKTAFPESPGRVSQIKSFTINKKALPDPPELTSPGTNAFLTQPKMVVLSWRGSDYQKFKLTVSSNINLQNPIVKTETTDTNYTLKDLPEEGNIYWQVAGITREKGDELLSEIRQFSVSKEQPKRLALYSPKDGAEFDSSSIQFKWQNLSKAEYLIEVSKNMDFTEILEKNTTNKNEYTFNSNLPSDIYFWRVTPTSDNKNIIPSSAYRFYITQTPKPTIEFPSDQTRIDIEFLSSLDIRWTKLKDAMSYDLELQSGNGRTIFKEYNIKKTYYPITDFTLIKTGSYKVILSAKVLLRNNSIVETQRASAKFSTFTSRKISPDDIKFKNPEKIYVRKK